METENFNLLEEKWIEVLREGGKKDQIAFYEVADREDPPVGLGSGVAEYDHGYILFLIGLFQTFYEPLDDREWSETYNDPPSPGELKEAVLSSDLLDDPGVFDLIGDGDRYMQDEPDPDDAGQREGQDLRFLFHNNFGSTRKEENQILRVNRRFSGSIPFGRAAALLTSEQAMGSGNSGAYYPSLRGGGPINLVVLGDTLWETIWLNVVPRDSLNEENHDRDGVLLPWKKGNPALEPKRGSKHPITYQPEDVHPHFVYWSMSKRIFLENDEGEIVSWKKSKTKQPFPSCGIGFEHPLTPKTETRNIDGREEKIHQKANADEQDAGSWTYMRYGQGGKKSLNIKALDADPYREVPSWAPRVWMFGPDYESNQSKVKGYIDRRMPTMTDSGEEAETLLATAEALIELIDECEDVLLSKLWKCQADRHSIRLWSHIEPDYLRVIRRIQTDGYFQSGELIPASYFEPFFKDVRETCLGIFDQELPDMLDNVVVPVRDDDGNLKGKAAVPLERRKLETSIDQKIRQAKESLRLEEEDDG